MAFFLIYRRSGGHFLNPILNFLNLILNLRQQLGALPQIRGTNRSLAPNLREMAKRRTSPAFFQQKSQSSCHCFDRHQLGFTNSILLNGIFDICSRIYSLQIGHQCYLQSAPSVGINLNHDLEEGSYWSINFVLTNKSVSPNLRVNCCLKFKIRFRKCPLRRFPDTL